MSLICLHILAKVWTFAKPLFHIKERKFFYWRREVVHARSDDCCSRSTSHSTRSMTTVIFLAGNRIIIFFLRIYIYLPPLWYCRCLFFVHVLSKTIVADDDFLPPNSDYESSWAYEFTRIFFHVSLPDNHNLAPGSLRSVHLYFRSFIRVFLTWFVFDFGFQGNCWRKFNVMSWSILNFSPHNPQEEHLYPKPTRWTPCSLDCSSRETTQQSSCNVVDQTKNTGMIALCST